MFNQIKIKMRNKRIIKILILIIIAILLFCFVMKNFFPAEWSFITPHKQGDFVRVGNMHLKHHVGNPILLDDGRVLFAGRNQSEYYDPKARKFYLIDNGNIEIRNLSAVKLNNGEVLFFGGARGTIESQSKVYIFNPKTNSFTYKGKMLIDRVRYAKALLNDGKVFIVGGKYIDYSWKTHSFSVKSTEFYNPKTNKFEKGPELPVEMPYMSKIIQLKNNDIYVFGCTFVDEYNCEERIYKLANGSDSFEYIDKFPCSNDDIYKLKSEEIITFCGISGNNKTVNKIVIFDPKTNEIKQKTLNLPDEFSSKTVLLPDDNLLFIASATGFATGYRKCKEVRIYDYKNDDLKILEKRFNAKRVWNAVATILKDGNLLILIEDGSYKKPCKAEIYMFNNKIEQ